MTPTTTVWSTRRAYTRRARLPHREAAWTILRERLNELAEGAGAIAAMFAAPADAPAATMLAEVRDALRKLAGAFGGRAAAQP